MTSDDVVQSVDGTAKPLTPEDIAQLGADVGVLVPLVKTLSDRWRWAKIAAALCLVVGLAGVGFGIKGTRDAHSANTAANRAQAAAVEAQRLADEIITNRTNSRVVNCHDANTFGSFHNALLDATEGVIRAAGAPNGTRTPEEQARTDQFVAENIAALEATRVAKRDCSADSVNRYYDTPTSD